MLRGAASGILPVFFPGHGRLSNRECMHVEEQLPAEKTISQQGELR